MKLDETNYVDLAEDAIKHLSTMKNQRTDKSMPMVTTSKIRNLLAMNADIYNEVMNYSDEKLSKEICSRIDYLKIRIIYEVGRDQSVKSFVNKTGILDVINQIKGSKKQYIVFSRYMEALVAYHKFYGGRD